MSAARTDDGSGNFAIDPSELFRVYPPKGERTASTRAERRNEVQDAEADPATELRIRNAQLEAEINALRTILETERERAERETRRVEEIKAERDKWCTQAERLALSPPVTPQPPRRSWWSLRRAG